MALQHLRSSTADKRPTPGSMSDGQLAMNTNLASPGLFFKDSNGDLVKVGPVHVGSTAPNASPAVGGQSGNSKGEQWLDTSSSRYVFKIWDGTAWRTEDGEFVNVSGDVMTGALGIIAGTAAAPGLYVSGDTNTGIYSPGADQVAISTNGTGRLFVDASGNIAIGRSTANITGFAGVTALTVANDVNEGVIELFGGSASNGGALVFGAGTQRQSQISGLSNGDIQFYTGGASLSEKLRLTSSGRLGLGTSSPGEKLDISSGTSGTAAVVKIQDPAGRVVQIASPSSSTEAYIGTTTNHRFDFYTNNTVKATLDTTGRLGIGTTSPATTLNVHASAGELFRATVSSNTSLYANIGADGNGGWFGSNTDLRLMPAGTERARIDSSGRLLVGTSSARNNFFNAAVSAAFQLEGTGTNRRAAIIGDDFEGSLILASQKSGAVGGNTVLASGDPIGAVTFQGNDGTEFVEAATITAYVDGTPGANDMPGRIVLSTTADGASSPTERMRIKADGNINIGGGTTGAYRVVIRTPNTTETTGSLLIENSSALGSIYFFNASGTGVNTSGAAMWIEKNSSTNRSINAGGTINASGADYAEYMTKAGEFAIAKGDVCGVTVDGRLTNVFADSVGFLVKSTNPSYVGGDTWGAESVVGSKPSEDEPELLAEWEAALETARQKVDRIAFAGQVPVNVTSATPGQYIVPIATEDGGITGITKDEVDLTLSEYMRAVGKVIAIEEDGRARIIVKVA